MATTNEPRRRSWLAYESLAGERRRLQILAVALSLLIPSLASAANPCADGGSPVPVRRGPGDEGGVGGTGIETSAAAGSEGGIGGTGISNDAESEGGIGGTGVQAEAETAIIGTVTGFASLCVGGTEIHYDETTSVRLDGATAGADALAIGQVVQVVAAGSGDQVNALSIDVDHVVAGPVTMVDADKGRVEVMGQRVLLADTVGERSIEVVAADFVVGQWVRVSGLRRADDAVAATRIEMAAEGEARVTGRLQLADPERGRVGDVPVRLPAATSADAATSVVAVGRWVAGELVAERVVPDSMTTLRRRVRRVQIEGYVDSGPQRDIEIGGWPIEVPEADRSPWSELPPGKRVQVKARVDRNGDLVPDGGAFSEPVHRRAPRNPRSFSDTDGGDQPNPPPPPQGPSRSSQPPRGEMPGAVKPQGGQRPGGPGRPPSNARPPRPPRPQRPDIPRAQRPKPPPRPPQPPRP